MRTVSSLLTSALVFGGIAVQAVPAQAADLLSVPKADYRLVAVSSEIGAYPAPPALDGTAAGAFDGDYATQWVSLYTAPAPAPHWLSIDLQRSISIKALDYSGKKGQRIDAKTVEVYVTDDAAVASASPADGRWGAAAATATLHAPTANDEKQRVELPTAVTGRYVAFVILDAQDPAGNGGGAGEIEVLSDAALPPIGVDPGNPPTGETVQLANGGTTATVSRTFPQIVGYDVGGTTIAGQRSSRGTWAVNGASYAAATTSTTTATGIDYVSTMNGIDVTVRSSIRVADDGTVGFEVTGVDGAASVTTLGLPDNAFLSASSADAGSVLDRTVISPDSTKNADEHIELTASTAPGQKGASFAFLGNGEVIGSVITNATTQASGGTASWNSRLTTRVTEADGRTAEIGSSAWLIHPTAAVDSRVTTYELPKVTVLFAGDRNDDDVVDWQDAGIRYREVDAPRLGADRVADRVVSRIPFNFASTATNYFDLVLDNTKRIANQTDGLGQWVLNKGYGSEGHDSSNTDYGGNYNERAGGLADLNRLVAEGAKLNADMSVHVNATEMYPQADAFDTAIIDGAAPYKPGWNWLDQSYYINQQADLGSGRVLDRFQQLRDEVPGLSGVYIDVYYSNGWVAEELADELHGMGLEVATEWGDKFVDSTVWSHWPNDLAYGGKDNKGINSTMVRFIQNGQADVWNDDALLGQQRLIDAEGWSGNRNWDGFVDNIWTQSLPTKFLQQFDLLTYQADTKATLTDDVEVAVDAGTRFITMDGATVLRGDSYLLPWQSLESNEAAGSPVDADKMYFYSASGGEKTFGLTDAFSANTSFDVFELGDQGRVKVGTVTPDAGRLTLTGKKGTAYTVVPQGGAQRAAVTYHDAGLDDPGFNSGSLDVWHPQGDVVLDRTAVGTQKNESRGDNIAVLGAAASSIGQTVTGLTPGQRYSFSAQVEIAPTATREVSVSVDAGAGTVVRTWNLSPTVNLMLPDSKAGQHYQRGAVSFVAPASGEVQVSIAAAAGAAKVRIDNARVMSDTTASDVAGTVYSDDFEGDQPGWGPFVYSGDPGGIRTSISRRHDPYTTSEWRNTAHPHAVGDALAGLAVDSTLRGEHSLVAHSELPGVVYRTDPSLVSLQSGHTYRIGFDYQAGASGSYRWVQGSDAVAGGAVASTVLQRTAMPQALETTAFSQDVVAGCGDYTWVGLERVGGPDVDFVLDDFTVTDLGPTTGGTPCATVSASTAVLNPGSQAAFTTTFTNSEDLAVENIGVALEVPEGYSIEVADGSSNLFATVEPGDSVTTEWLITAPAAAAGASVDIGIAATYLADCDVRTVKTTVQTSVAARARIPNAQIVASANSSETDSEDGAAANMLDGAPGTFWVSQWSTEPVASFPHVLTFDLGSAERVDGISYLRRTANVNGPLKGYQVAVSTDGQTFSDVTSGEWANAAEWQDTSFESTTARYVRITATSSISGSPFAAVAEIAIYGSQTPKSGHAPKARPADDLGECTPVTDPELRLDASSVRAGETVGANLTGFAPSSTVSFWLDDRRLADAEVDPQGGLTSRLLIPADTERGTRDVIVKSASGDVLASAPLKVKKAKPAKGASVTVSIGTVRGGSSVEVRLRGFEAGVLVQLWLHSEPVRVGEVVVSDSGEASATITIPAGTPAGAHSVVVTDAEGAELARTGLSVTAAPASAGGGGLANTGTDGSLWSTVGISALVLIALGALLWTRRRSAS